MIKTLIYSIIMTIMLSTAAVGADSKFADLEARYLETNSLAEMAAERRTRPLLDLTAEEHQIMAYEREFLNLMYSELEEGMSHLAENAVVCPPGMEAIWGRDTQTKLYKELINNGLDLDYEPVDVSVSPSGEMAWAHGIIRWKMGDGPVEFYKYISIYEKIDGKWMNVVEMRNSIR